MVIIRRVPGPILVQLINKSGKVKKSEYVATKSRAKLLAAEWGEQEVVEKQWDEA